MRHVLDALLGGIVAAAATGAACAQTAKPPMAPASAPVPMTAASRMVPPRSPAAVAAENAKEPGVQRPDERVIPQIALPLRPRSAADAATASAPAGTVPGTVNDGAARCLALRSAVEKAACERGLAASAPVPPR